MKKSIAIYNPYLETKGGGEKVCLALASVLAGQEGYEVSLLTHNDTDLDELAAYFHIDLSRVKVIYINFETVVVKILHRLPIPGRLRNFFLDYKVYRFIKRYRFDLFVNCCYQSNLPNPSKTGVYMCMFPQQLNRQAGLGFARNTYLMIMSGLYRLFLHPAHKNAIDSYQTITANSHYTQEHIKKRWGRDSSIIYPICENMQIKSREAKKKKIILNVGRFFANSGENHHKRQDVLLETFTKMTELHKLGWELHFAGSVAEDVAALKYILQLIKYGQNLPVFFHFNASFSELRQLYNEATIYWHATGYGSDAIKHPEKQEHFGIVTVEAMSAGCIPIVIDSAGQKESVQNGVNGYLWSNLNELEKFTTQVSNFNEDELKSFTRDARKSAQKYNNLSFNISVKKFLAGIDI